MTQTHLVFVYGTLKKNCKYHYILKKAYFIDNAITSEKYTLYKGKYPYVFKGKQTSKIKGEVYLISDNILKKLDIFEDHPQEYRREKINVFLINKKQVVSAWIYFHLKPEGEIIENGNYIE